MPDFDVDLLIGDTLRDIRKSKSLTQIEVANSIGITKYTLSRVENGHHSPTKKIMYCLCEYYGIEYKQLVKMALLDSLLDTKSN